MTDSDKHSTPADEGFSLIELLLVIVIMGILTTVVVLSVTGITGEAEDSACLADHRTLEKAAEAYFAQRGVREIAGDPGDSESYEQTLADEGFIRAPSRYYDLDASGKVVGPVRPCD